MATESIAAPGAPFAVSGAGAPATGRVEDKGL